MTAYSMRKLFANLLVHKWRQLVRSPQFGMKLLGKIMGMLISLYAVFMVLMLGFFLDKIIVEVKPDVDPVRLLNGYILHAFLALMAMRFLAGKLPTVALQPWLPLPIHKGLLLRCYLLLMLGRVGNLMPLLFVLPFLFRGVIPHEGILPGLYWLAGFVLLSLSSTLGDLLLKLWLFSRPISFSIFVAGLMSLSLLEYQYGMFGMHATSQWLFNGLLEQSVVQLILGFIIFGVCILITYRMLFSRLYLDFDATLKWQRKENAKSREGFKNVHKLPMLLRLELRLLVRNKMARRLFYRIFAVSIIGLSNFIVNGLKEEKTWMMALGMMLILGAAGIYIANALRYKSTFFDGLLTRPLNQAFVGKAVLIIGHVLALLVFVLLFPLAALTRLDVAPLMLALLLYATGIINNLLMLINAFCYTRVEIHGSPMQMTGGLAAASFVITLILLVIPAAIPFSLLWHFDSMAHPMVYLPVGVIGLLGLMLHPYWMKPIYEMINKQKYKIAEGFRKS